MSDICNVSLTCRITAEPELKYVGANNTALLNLYVAMNRNVKRGDKFQDVATFLDVKLWGRQAEYVGKYAHKGTQMAIAGDLEREEWEDKQSGQKRSRTVIVGRDVTLFSQQSQGKSASNSPDPEEIPF